MGKHYDLLEKLYQKLQDENVRHDFLEKMDGHMETLLKKSPETYKHMMDKFEGITCAIDADEAETIVRKMTPRGQQWSMSDVQRMIDKKMIQGNPVYYYMVLNMVYNDYYETAARFGLQSNPDFYIALAKDFINDPDGAPHKVEKYFRG